ncbi:hypothetical protein BP6252_00538 [Coleophoma cylindrospora]|uniref:Rhodopsin domain-containing protein n=1 Tax=Coleophoma cylindrospora TaxID=1849047 RepID=A0A3D8SQB2_9HELO|nr:hypothetical protein BP6252_00538 [Coleophoma cylindrospora]
MSNVTSGTYLAGVDLAEFNVADTTSLTHIIITLNIVFMTLVSIVAVLRIFIRICVVHAAGLDDYLMVLAAVFALILSSFFLVGASQGLGKHIWVIMDESGASFLTATKHITQSLYAGYLAYTTAISLTKVSIAASYLRIFPAVRNAHLRRLVIATAALVVTMWFCSIFAIIFECRPVQAAWDWDVPNGNCINILGFFYVAASTNILTDLVLWVAPLSYFWRMNIRAREKALLCLLFSFAGFACVASILRLSQIHDLRAGDLTCRCFQVSKYPQPSNCDQTIPWLRQTGP